MARQPEPWERVDKKTGKHRGWYATVGGKQIKLADAGMPKSAAWAELRRVLGGEREREQEADRAVLARDVFALYLDRQRTRVQLGQLTEKALRQCVFFLKAADKGIGRTRADSVTADAVEKWLATRKTWGQTTRQNAGSVVRAAYHSAVRRGVIDKYPLSGLKLPRPRRRALPTREQFEVVMAAGDSRQWKDISRLLYLTGCRPGEICTLEAKDIDFEAGVAWVIDKIRHKTGKERRVVPLVDEAIAILKRNAEMHPAGPVLRNKWGKPWTTFNIAQVIRRKYRRLGRSGEQSPPYTLRHLFGTEGASKMPIHVLAKVMGHIDTATTLRNYVHSPEEISVLRDAVKATRGDGSVEEPEAVRDPRKRRR